jgi:putative endonuclease
LILYIYIMHYLYIIYSKNLDTYYIGETNDLEERLFKHNTHIYKKSFTKAASDWHFVLKFKCINRSDALFLERFIKRMKSKRFIGKIIKTPEILHDILNKR